MLDRDATLPKTRHAQIAARFVTAEAAASAVCAFATAIAMLFPGKPAEHALFWNISAARLMLAAVPLAVFAASAVLLVRGLSNPSESHRMPRRLIVGTTAEFTAWAFVALGAVGLLVPAYSFGVWADYYARLRPLLIWIGTMGAQGLTLVWMARGERTQRDLDGWLLNLRPLWRAAAWIALILITLGVVMSMTIHAVRTYEDYRYEPGVPILIIQVAAAILAGIVFRRSVDPRIAKGARRADVAIFVVIWALAATYWASIRAPISYMNPAPLPPNEEMYPFSDAAGYDLQAQSAVLGLGLNGGQAVQNPIYPTELAIVHLVSGQDFEGNMNLQAALLAVLPGLAYLLGKRLQGRSLGISAACMLAFHGANTILAAGMINTASPKQMLTDFPTAIGVALVVLSALQLADRESDVVSASFWQGASVAFAYMIRPTALVLLAVVPLSAWLRETSLRGRLRVIVLAVAAFFVFLLPWGARNGVVDGGAITAYFSKINLITESRYVDEQPGGQARGATQEPTPASTVEPSDRATPILEESRVERAPQMDAGSVASVMAFHFANNVMGSVLILPTSAEIQDLRHELRAPGAVWEFPWDGTLRFWQIVWLMLWVAMLAAGGATLWRAKGAPAAIPLVVFVLYEAANSIARTSGGRYIVPVDWVVFLYCAAGLLAIFDSGIITNAARSGRTTANSSPPRRRWIAALAGIVMLGAMPLLVEVAVPAHFTREQRSAASVDASARSALLRAGFSAGEIDAYINADRSRRVLGRAFYPRRLSYRALVNGAEGNLPRLDFPHLQFALVGADGLSRDIFLFTAGQAKLGNGTDVLVLGCRDEGTHYVEALAVVDLAERAGPPLISDRPALTCRLERPVCDPSGNCK